MKQTEEFKKFLLQSIKTAISTRSPYALLESDLNKLLIIAMTEFEEEQWKKSPLILAPGEEAVVKTPYGFFIADHNSDLTDIISWFKLPKD